MTKTLLYSQTGVGFLNKKDFTTLEVKEQGQDRLVHSGK